MNRFVFVIFMLHLNLSNRYSHWRFITLDLFRLNHCSIDRHETCTCVALEIFDQRANHSSSTFTSRWILHDDESNRVFGVSFNRSAPAQSSWVLTKMRKVPERGFIIPNNSHAKNLFDMNVFCYRFFYLIFSGIFSRIFFFFFFNSIM